MRSRGRRRRSIHCCQHKPRFDGERRTIADSDLIHELRLELLVLRSPEDGGFPESELVADGAGKVDLLEVEVAEFHNPLLDCGRDVSLEEHSRAGVGHSGCELMLNGRH